MRIRLSAARGTSIGSSAAFYRVSIILILLVCSCVADPLVLIGLLLRLLDVAFRVRQFLERRFIAAAASDHRKRSKNHQHAPHANTPVSNDKCDMMPQKSTTMIFGEHESFVKRQEDANCRIFVCFSKCCHATILGIPEFRLTSFNASVPARAFERWKRMRNLSQLPQQPFLVQPAPNVG